MLVEGEEGRTVYLGGQIANKRQQGFRTGCYRQDTTYLKAFGWPSVTVSKRWPVTRKGTCPFMAFQTIAIERLGMTMCLLTSL